MPSDYDKRCVVCDRHFTTRQERQLTCGHPRCIRENNRRRNLSNIRAKRAASARRPRISYSDPIPDKRTRDRVTLAWERARVLDGWDRITATAIASKQTVATTISVLRSVGVAV